MILSYAAALTYFSEEIQEQTVVGHAASEPAEPNARVAPLRAS